MTETQLVSWVLANWPSAAIVLVTASLLTKAYANLSKYEQRLHRQEKAVKRLLSVCSSVHPDKGKDLFNGDNDE